MRGIGFYNPSLHGVRQYAAEKSEGAGGRCRPASHDRFAAYFTCPEAAIGFAGHDVLQDPVDVRLGEVLHPLRAGQWNDVAANSTDVADNGCRFLRPSALTHDRPGAQIVEVKPTQLLDRDDRVFELSLFRRIFAAQNLAEQDPCLLSRRLGRPEAMQPDGEAARAAGEPVVNDIAALAGGVHPQTEARQLIVPDEVVLLPRFGGIRGAFREFWHLWRTAFPWRTRQGSAGNEKQRRVASSARLVGTIRVL